MIKQYFETLLNTLLDEENSLNKKKTDMENRMKEIDRFIEILEEKNDTSFESFTPREVNSKNKEMIKELKLEKKTIQNDLIDVNQKIKNHENSKDEFNSMITYLKDQEMKQQENRELELQMKNISHEKNLKFEEQISNIYTVIKKANSSLHFIDVDPMRAKIELQLLLQQLQIQIENLHSIY